MRNKSKCIRFVIIVVIGVLPLFSAGQDINFSQFYPVKNYYNPGFVASDMCTDIFFHTKYEAAGFDGGFKTVTASYSSFFPELNLGLSVYLQNDFSPQNIFTDIYSTSALVYRINLSKFKIAAWLQPEFYYWHVNSANIVSGSMIDALSGQVVNSLNTGFSQSQYGLSLNFGYLLFGRHFFAGNSFKNYARLENLFTPEKAVFTVAGFDADIDRDKTLELYLLDKNLSENQLGFLFHFNNVFAGTNAGFYYYSLNKIGFDFGVKLNSTLFSFNYTLLINKIWVSIYEISIDFRFKCKKAGKRAIICPAYQL